MNTARAHTTGPIGTTVLEALSTLLAPELRERVLSEALALEGGTEVPEDLSRARAFVEGPLRLVVKRRVGPVMAGFLVETLAPIFYRIESAPPPDPFTRPTRRPSSGAAPRAPRVPESKPKERPASGMIRIERNRMRVVLASRAPDAATGISRWMKQDANVLALSHPADIVTAISSMPPPWWLVIDLCVGPVDPKLVTEISLEDPDMRVFVWGELPTRFAHLLEQQGWESLDAGPDWAAAAQFLRDRLPEARVRAD